MRTSRVDDSFSNRHWRSLTRCLPVSCVPVALQSGTFHVLHARVLGCRTNGANRWHEPNLWIARDDAHTVLFRERCGVRPERTKSYCRRKAVRLPAGSERRSAQSALETPTPRSLRPLFLHSGPSRAPDAAAVASELRCTHGLGAHPRLARGMSRRLQQSTNLDFQRRTPASCIAIRLVRAVKLAGRRKPPFTTRLPLRCVDSVHTAVHRMKPRFDGSSDIPSHLERRFLGRGPQVKVVSTEPPVTVQARLSRPGIPSSRPHAGTSAVVIQALEAQLTLRAQPQSTAVSRRG